MFENKENRDMGFNSGKNESSDKKSATFDFINKNLKNQTEIQDKKALEDQKEILDGEKKKKAENIIDQAIEEKDNENDKDKDKNDEKNINWKEKANNLLQSFRKKINHEDTNASNVLKTNLIQGTTTVTFDWGKNITPIFSSFFISIFIICIVYIGLILWEDKTINRGTALINDTEALIIKIKQAQKKAEAVNIFQKKIGLVKYLLEEHVYWTKFFNFLEDNTLTVAYYSEGFTGSTNGSYNFSVVTENYSSINDFINILKNNDYVLDSTVTGAMLGADKNKNFNKNAATSFELLLKLNPTLFKK